ncbi:MAG TPA: sigma-70 family RNA polymerase sigma factor [Acidisarcina sp.]|nr:sigma-70 family RNA polymerase sigma factor [Acidisarcina sp.]
MSTLEAACGQQRNQKWNRDHEIVSRVQRGDHGAFDELVVRHEGKLRSIALRLTGSPYDAEDVVQQSLMKAFEKIRNFRGDSQFSTWVTRIVMNESLMFLRQQRRDSCCRNPLIDEDGEVLPEAEVVSRELGPESIAEREELAVVLRNAIQGLPKAWSAVIFLHDIESRTIEETASTLGITVAAAKSRRLRARLELRRRLSRRVHHAARKSDS